MSCWITWQLHSSWSLNFVSLFLKLSAKVDSRCWPPSLGAVVVVLAEFGQLELLQVQVVLELLERVAVVAHFVQVYLDVPFVWVFPFLKCVILTIQMF